MNDEPVVLFQVSNPVLDVSGRVAVSMLVSKAITTEEFEERLSDLLRNMESLALLKVECDNTSHLRRSIYVAHVSDFGSCLDLPWSSLQQREIERGLAGVCVLGWNIRPATRTDPCRPRPRGKCPKSRSLCTTTTGG